MCIRTSITRTVRCLDARPLVYLLATASYTFPVVSPALYLLTLFPVPCHYFKMHFHDEGYTDEEHSPLTSMFPSRDTWVQRASLQDKEGGRCCPFCKPCCSDYHAELAYKLLSSLPISSLARVQRKIAPLLQLDIIGVCPQPYVLPLVHLSE